MDSPSYRTLNWADPTCQPPSPSTSSARKVVLAHSQTYSSFLCSWHPWCHCGSPCSTASSAVQSAHLWCTNRWIFWVSWYVVKRCFSLVMGVWLVANERGVKGITHAAMMLTSLSDFYFIIHKALWLEKLQWHFDLLGVWVSQVFGLWCSQYLELQLPDIHMTFSLNSFKYLVKWHQVIMLSDVIKETLPDHSIWNTASVPFIFFPLLTLFLFLVVFITWETEHVFVCLLSIFYLFIF